MPPFLSRLGRWLGAGRRARPAGGGQRKASAAGPLIALQSPGRPVWTPRDYAALAREGFARNAVVYRCVRMIAEAAGSLAWLAYEDVRGLWRELAGAEPEPVPPYRADWPLAAVEERLAAGLARHLRPLAAAATGPGDVLLFRWRRTLPAAHLGVRTGPRAMVHAHARLGVCEVALVPAWLDRIAGGFRFPWA